MTPTALLIQVARLPVLESNLHWLGGGAEISWRAAFELLLIGTVIYAVLRFLEGTRGARLMQAVLVILTAMLFLALVAQLFELDRIIVLYPYFVGGAFLVALVVFQPELRRGLMRIGEKLGRRSRTAQSGKLIDAVVHACANLSRRKIGALIAIERRVPVGGLMETGVPVDAEVTHELLETIFWPGSALHDMGVIISQGRLAAAGCEFPLAEADATSRIIGSRHRAALGMSFETDALVVVVSEETGAMSLAARGELRRCATAEDLRNSLLEGMLGLASAKHAAPAAGPNPADTNEPAVGAAQAAPAAQAPAGPPAREALADTSTGS